MRASSIEETGTQTEPSQEDFEGNTRRKLVSLRQIAELRPIKGADNIECAIIDGWQVVVKKGTFLPGDTCVYFEIDSFVPVNTAATNFLEKNAIKYRGRWGARIKTIRLRGQISQGLALPLNDLPIKLDDIDQLDVIDLDKAFDVVKWEKQLPGNSFGNMEPKGNFPSFIPKTDQERVQNIFNNIDRDDTFEVTQKLDGSSMTVFKYNEQSGVCSRNFELKPPSFGLDEKVNLFWRAAMEQDLLAKIDGNYALQGELVGPGIQGNRGNYEKVMFICYDIWNIEAQRYVLPEQRRALCALWGISHVHCIHSSMKVYFTDVASLLEWTEMVQEGEGLVWKSNSDSSASFKSISNKYLLKHDE